ncbi:hypothetical protein Q5752_000848 [Cryptotrichosporon argae]
MSQPLSTIDGLSVDGPKTTEHISSATQTFLAAVVAEQLDASAITLDDREALRYLAIDDLNAPTTQNLSAACQGLSDLVHGRTVNTLPEVVSESEWDREPKNEPVRIKGLNDTDRLCQTLLFAARLHDRFQWLRHRAEGALCGPSLLAAASVVDTIPPAARAFLDEITANKGSLDQAAVAQSVLCFLRVEFEKCNLSVFPGSRDGANKAGSTVAESSGTTWSDEELKDYGSSLKPWADMVESIREKVFDLVPESRNPDNHEGVHTVLTLASGEVTDQTTPLSAAYQGLSDLVYKRMVNVPDMGTEQAGISLGPEDRIYTMLYYVPALRDRYRWQIERPTSRGVPGA